MIFFLNLSASGQDLGRAVWHVHLLIDHFLHQGKREKVHSFTHRMVFVSFLLILQNSESLYLSDKLRRRQPGKYSCNHVALPNTQLPFQKWQLGWPKLTLKHSYTYTHTSGVIFESSLDFLKSVRRRVYGWCWYPLLFIHTQRHIHSFERKHINISFKFWSNVRIVQ